MTALRSPRDDGDCGVAEGKGHCPNPFPLAFSRAPVLAYPRLTDGCARAMVRKTKSKSGTTLRAPAIVVGWREWVGLPELGDARIKAKIDTGARTSAIHAWEIQPFEREGEDWVRFELHPNQGDNKTRIACEARVIDSRTIKSSNGQQQKRYVIRTPLRVGDHVWPIELTLTRRDEMGFRMLVGRTALKPRALVNPSKSYLCPTSA
jgi:hypothetical protein